MIDSRGLKKNQLKGPLIKKPPLIKPKKKSFASDVLKLMGGTAFAQVLGIIALPILTRLFAPEAFGILGTYGAVVGIIGIIACLRYELTLVLPRKDVYAANLFWVCFSFVLLWTGLASVAVFFFGPAFAEAINAPDFAPFLWLLPLGIFLKGAYNILSYWNTRRAEFGRLAVAQISNSMGTTGSKLGAGFLGFLSGGALIIGSLMGTVLASLVLFFRVFRSDSQRLLKMISPKICIGMIKRYQNIAIFNTPASFLHTFSHGLPLILLASFFGPAIVGFYSLGNKVLHIPGNLIGKSVRKVFYQRAADDWNRTGSVSSIVSETIVRLHFFGFGVMTVCFLVAVPVTELAFGAQWRTAGEYMQWTAVMVGFDLICSPISGVTTILRREKVNLYFGVVFFIGKIGALLVGGMIFNDPYITIAILSVVSSLSYCAYIAWVLHVSRVSYLSLFRRIRNVGGLSVTMVVLALLLSNIYEDQMLGLAIVLVAMYLLVVGWLSKDYWYNGKTRIGFANYDG